MRYWVTALLFTVLLGCGPKLSKEDLGTVVFENPKVTGSEEPYEIPHQADDNAKNSRPDATKGDKDHSDHDEETSSRP